MPSFYAGLATFVRSSHVQPSAVGGLSPKPLADASPSHGSRTTAQAVANQLGLDRVEVEILPQQKSEVVTKLRDEGRKVAMAGDGINDSPALAQAHVGIATGTGTGVAIQIEDVLLFEVATIPLLMAASISPYAFVSTSNTPGLSPQGCVPQSLGRHDRTGTSGSRLLHAWPSR